MIEQLLKKMEGAYAENTIRAYRIDFDVFSSWCKQEGLCPLPAKPDTISDFIGFDMQHSSSATIRRRMASIRKIHKLARMPDPTKDEDVFLSLRRMHRQKGRWQRQAFAMTIEIRDKLIAITDNSIKGYRDRALLHFAYDSMRRRSELCSCEWSEITINPDGTGSWFMQFSKSDQEGYGKNIPLNADTIDALKEWKTHANLSQGKVLRGFVRQEIIGSSLDSSHIAKIFKKLAKKADLSEQIRRDISGHSARVGHAHDLLKEGKSLPQIMVAGGWKSTDVVMRYIENSNVVATL
jgi:site-specific recombinase XerD